MTGGELIARLERERLVNDIRAAAEDVPAGIHAADDGGYWLDDDAYYTLSELLDDVARLLELEP